MMIHSPQTKVLSIPTGDSYEVLLANLVYSCPASRTYRQRGGEMDRIFSVDGIHTLSPQHETAWNLVNPAYRERIKQYISDRADYFGSPQGRQQHCFYILSESEQLLHRPRPSQSLQGRIRYTWQELTVGESVIER